jgi:sigma-B regulation protein RsbU (phosphoserine phosphatase)
MVAGKDTPEAPVKRKASDLGYDFSPLQVGSIADCIEPLSATTDAEWALNSIAELADVEVIPIERDDAVIGYIERSVLQKAAGSTLQRLFQKDLESYVLPAHSWVDATEYIDRIVEKDLEQDERNDQGWYIVQHRRSYLGIVNIRTMLLQLNTLRAQDLRRAGEMQRHLLAKDSPTDTRFGCVFYNRMAHEVGGDFHSSATLGPNRRLIACFDVAGKNVSGALAVNSLGAFFASLRLLGYSGDIGDTAGLFNALIREVNPDDVFVAAVLFFLDFETKTVDIYNCGYSPVFIFAPQEDRKVSCRISRPSLPPLGIEDTLENHSPVSVPMESGLRFVAFSDGLTDMTNPWGERYGEERCQEFLRTLYKERQSSIPKLVDAEVTRWIGESSLADDITLVDLRFN